MAIVYLDMNGSQNFLVNEPSDLVITVKFECLTFGQYTATFIRTLFSNSHCFFLWYVVKSEDFIFRHQLLLENLCTLLTGSCWLDDVWDYIFHNLLKS